MMLLRHVNVASDGGTISKSKIIKHLIQYNMVPIKKSSLYVLMKRCANGLLRRDSSGRISRVEQIANFREPEGAFLREPLQKG